MALLDSTSFYYNGSDLSMFGLRIGWYEGSDTEELAASRDIIQAESNMVRPAPNQYGTVYNPLTFTFDIFKVNGELNYEESRILNNWLFSPETYTELRFNGEQNISYKALCIEASDIVNGIYVGKRLTFQTDSPFAYAGTVSKTINVESDTTVSIYNSSDRGNYYPTMEITGIGNSVTISNVKTNDTMEFDLSSIPDKYIKIDGKHYRITDSDNKIIPLYKLGLDTVRWFYLVPGSNQVRIIGKCKFKISTNFERRVGIL